MDFSDQGTEKKQGSAEISVFLALVFVLVASLVLTSVEMLRTQTTTTYLKIAADSAIDSLFSQYHLDLWNEYRLLGLEMYAPAEITDEYYGFLEPYLSRENNKNWYGLTAEKEEIGIDEYKLLTDDNGSVFEKEVREYMLYGIALDLAGLTERKEAQTSMDSALSTNETANEMENCSKKAKNLEKKLNTLAESVSEHNRLIPKMREALSEGDGSDVRDYLKKLRRSLSAIVSDADSVSNGTEDLKVKVTETRTGLNEKLAGGKITLENFNQLETQMEGFDSYTETRGQKNRELQTLLKDAERNSVLLEQLEEEADAAEEYIDQWEPEQILVGYGPPETEGGEPVPIYEEEVLDEVEVWRTAADCFTSYESLEYSVGGGEIDEEKSNQFDAITNLLAGNLIELVFPGGSKVSKEERDLTNAPSATYLTSDTNIFNSDLYLLNKMAVDEYAMMELSNVLSKENKVSSAAKKEVSSVEETEISSAEVEYVLWGNKTDMENVSAVAGELIAVRSGLNLAYLFTDPLKLKDAGALAVKISGGGSGTPIVLVVTFLILTVWAAAQAVIDTRRLFEEEKVPFFHTKKTFTLTLENLLTNFKGELTKKSNSLTGMKYHEYLRLFLFSRSGSRTDYRIMDVIQGNLRKQQPDFRVDRLYTSLDMTVTGRSDHVFSDLLGGGLGKYAFYVSSSYGY